MTIPLLLWLLLFGLAAPAAAAEPASRAELLLKTKPATLMVVTEVTAQVRLTCPGQSPRRVTLPPSRSHGTGYLITPDGHIATNGHVVAAYYGDDDREAREDAVREAIQEACLDPGLSEPRRRELVRQLMPRVAPGAGVELRKGLSVVLANRERFAAEVKAFSPALGEQGHQGRTVSPRGRVSEAGKDVAILKIDAGNLPTLRLGDSDRVKIGDPLAILGYPGVVVDHDFLDKRSAVEATVTAGLVSSLRRDARGTPVIQTDAAASWGSSGGPAIDAQGEVIGMLTFISVTADQSQSVQGFNFLVPANVVKEFARVAGAPLDTPSPFNRVWHDAVDRFMQRDWTGALAGLDAAGRLVPNLPDVQRLQVEAQLALLKRSSWPDPTVLAGLAIGVIVTIGGTWVLLRRRRAPTVGTEIPGAASGALPGIPAPVRLSANDVARALAQRLPLVLIDLRAEEAWTASGIQAKDAVRSDPETVVRACADYPRDHAIVLYCDSPDQETSFRAARRLAEAGYTRVAVLAGGFAAWQDAGLPLTRSGRRAMSPLASHALPPPPPAGAGLERHGRFAVGVKGGGPYFNAQATRVRTSGLTLQAPQALTPGERLRLTIFLGRDTLELAGRVAVSGPAEGGTHEVEVAFDPLSADAAVTLEGFLLARRAEGAA